jgi:L-ribulose-5-phosphate 3-epimerase
MTRRELLKKSSLLAALVSTGFYGYAANSKKLRIGACDWSLGKSSDVGSFQLAKSIGLSGVQLNLGSEQNNLHLRQSEIQKLFLQESRKTSINIASLAIGELNQVPYKSEARTEAWVWDSIDVAKAFDVSVILLAFFSKNDLRNDEHGKREVIRRLKMVAPKAEKAGVTLGIESYLSAEEHMDIIQQVGSKSVKVFYDFRNSADAGYDVVKEIKWLGKDAVCELHMKENGLLLGTGTLDWEAICDTLLNMEFYGDGWMQIEWSLPDKADLVTSYKHNFDFLNQSFRY